MIYADSKNCGIISAPFSKREITVAFHDIDGTHSLIRNWPPVMSIVLDYVAQSGISPDYDSEENAQKLISLAGTKPLPETDRFCVESAGLSALTQMEWSIRRAIENGKITLDCDKADNKDKIRRIWLGEETFASPDSPALTAFLNEHTPRLFKFYERVLNGFCRDRNLAEARDNPEKYIVPGSREFLRFLHNGGVKNYFVTGAVVEKGMGMYEEVETLGYKIGEGELIDGIIGSTWTEKLPKNVIMEHLKAKLGVPGEHILITGDGRSEISAGASMGALCLSRLPESAAHQRELHKKLGTNIIVADYLDENLYKIFHK